MTRYANRSGFSRRQCMVGRVGLGPGKSDAIREIDAAGGGLSATLFDLDLEGHATKITNGGQLGSQRGLNSKASWYSKDGRLIRPSHFFTKAKSSPVPAGDAVRIDIGLLPGLIHVPAGHQLRLVVATQPAEGRLINGALADVALQQTASNIEQEIFCCAFSFHRVPAMLSCRWSRSQTTDGGAMKSWIVTVMLAACASEPKVQPIGEVNQSLNVASLSAGIISTRADAYKAATDFCAARHESTLVMGIDDNYGSGVGARSTTIRFNCSAQSGSH